MSTTAYSLDGTDDYITLPDFSQFSSYTYSAWVNPDDVNNFNHIIDIRANNYNVLRINDNGKYEIFQQDSSDTNYFVTGGTPTVGEWDFATATWDGSTVKLYVNGTQVASQSVSSMEDRNISDYIGGSPFGNYFDGTIEDVRIYDHALSAGEVQYLYEVSQQGTYVSSKKEL